MEIWKGHHSCFREKVIYMKSNKKIIYQDQIQIHSRAKVEA